MSPLPEEGSLLRIFIAEEEKHGRMLLYEALYTGRNRKDWQAPRYLKV